MSRFLANCIFGALALMVLGGCASVKDTAQYYVAFTPKVYPPKPRDAPIPILGKEPREKHEVIGALKFESTEGWNFLRRSMIYNAQIHGADAVILTGASRRREMAILQVAPQWDWIPVSNWYRDKKGNTVYSTSWIPLFRPGYTQPYFEEITGIDARMVVFTR